MLEEGFSTKLLVTQKNNPIITIQGVDSTGVGQTVVFSKEGCSYTSGQERSVSGIATSQDLQNLCQPSQGTNLSQAQFDCALNLCQGGNGQLETRKSPGCSNPTVSYSSSTQSCTVQNCTTADGTDLSASYQISQQEYLSNLNSWGMNSTGLAFACAGVPITNTPREEQTALETIEGSTSTTGQSTGTGITNTSTQKVQTGTTTR